MQVLASAKIGSIVLALLVVLHLFLRVTLGYGQSSPDLLVVALLMASRGLSLGAGSALGFILGILEDGFSAMAFGAHAFSLSVLGLLSCRVKDIFVGDSSLFVAAYFFCGKFVRDLLYWSIIGTAARDPFWNIFLPDALLASAYVGIVGVLFSIIGGVSRGTR